MRRSRGLTLVEVLMVIAVISVVMITLLLMIMQNNKLYMRTAVHLDPQASQMIALKRMERELREAMQVLNSPEPATWIHIILPIKDQNGFNVLSYDAATGELGLTLNTTDTTKPMNPNISYFLGNKVSAVAGKTNTYVAEASTTGTCIFRATSMPSVDSDIFPEAQLIAEGVLNPPLLPDPNNPGKIITGNMFDYFPYPPDQQTVTNLTHIIRVSVTTPIPVKESSGIVAGIPWKGYWTAGTAYAVNDAVNQGGQPYICRQDHGASADNKPGVGKDWETYWDAFAEHSLSTQFELRNLGNAFNTNN